MKSAYASASQRLSPLLENQEITFDLLWAIFKPNTAVYSKCPGTDKARCIKYSFGDRRFTKLGKEYFHIEGSYLDFDGLQLGEATTALGIYSFHGVKRINSLDVFPLEYHDDADIEKNSLITNGRTFVKLTKIHHRHYDGNAFRWEQGEVDKTFVNGRIILDAVLFREMDPNYERARIDKLKANNPPALTGSITWHLNTLSPKMDRLPVKTDDAAAANLSEDDLLFCSPTVIGYSLDKKKWRKSSRSWYYFDNSRLKKPKIVEFAVADITDICWNAEPFERLIMDENKKKALQDLTTYHIRERGRLFDDIMSGKGRGLVILLQCDVRPDSILFNGH
jgi:hypothetical protein